VRIKKLIFWKGVQMKLFMRILFVCAILAVAYGCIKTIDSAGYAHYSLDPNTGAAIQTGLDTGATVATSAGVFWPALAGIGVILGWAAGLWRKLNPVLSQAYTKQEITDTVLSGVVKAIEAVATTKTTTDMTIGELVKSMVADNLRDNGIYAEGKQIISDAKNL
jgi:hypothetical protein